MEAGDPSGFGPLLRRRRQGAGLTQRELAGRAGLSLRAVGDLERGRARPYLRTVSQLAAALDLPGPARAELATAARQDLPDSPLPGVPRQLPAAAGGFAGRLVELAALDAIADGPAPIAVVSGIAGAGKTALAVRWGHQATGRFPDGQLYANLRGFGGSGPPVAPQAAIQDFLEALGVPPTELPWRAEAQAALYRRLMAGRRMLVLLDDAHDAGQVRPLLPGGSGCLTLITSRDPLAGLAGPGAGRLRVPALSRGESAELLRRRLGARRVRDEEPAAAEILQLTGGLPLALSIVAARAAADPSLPLAALGAELRDVRGRLDALGGGEVSADLRAAFSWSYQRLSSPAARMFRRLGSHPGPDISAAAAASLAATTPARAAHALAELAAAGLASEAAGRFSAHDLVRAYAAELSRQHDGELDRRAALTRMLDHYLHTALAARQLIDPSDQWPWPGFEADAPAAGVAAEPLSGHTAAMDWFAAERPVLMPLLATAADGGFDRHAQQLPPALSRYLNLSGHWQEWEHSLRTGLAAARRRGDVLAQAWAHSAIGSALTHLGHILDAPPHLRDAERLFGQAGSPGGQASAVCLMAVVLCEHQQFTEGLEHAQRALAGYQAAGLGTAQATALQVIGWAQTELGDHAAAEGSCRRALAIAAAAGDRVLAARVEDTMGMICRNRGQYGQAIARHQRALAESRELGHRWGVADALLHLGQAHWAAGDPEAASQVWQQAMGILDDLCHPDAAWVRDRLSAPAPVLRG